MRYSCILLVCLAVLLTSCGGGTVRFGNPQPLRISQLGFDGATRGAGDSLTAVVHLSGGAGPYTVTLDFSDAVTPNTASLTVPHGTTLVSIPFTFDTFTKWDYPLGRDVAVTVNLSDGNGASATPVVANFTVFGTL